eukprot:1242203-Ditylum_brightwellii.AAC.1
MAFDNPNNLQWNEVCASVVKLYPDGLNGIKSGHTLERHFKDFMDNNMMLPHPCNLVDKEDCNDDDKMEMANTDSTAGSDSDEEFDIDEEIDRIMCYEYELKN